MNTVRRALNSDRHLIHAVTECTDEINKPIPDPLVDLDVLTLSNVVMHLPFSAVNFNEEFVMAVG